MVGAAAQDGRSVLGSWTAGLLVLAAGAGAAGCACGIAPTQSQCGPAERSCGAGQCVTDCAACPGQPVACAERCVADCAGCPSPLRCGPECVVSCAACAGSPATCGAACTASCAGCADRCTECPTGTHLCPGGCVFDRDNDPAVGCRLGCEACPNPAHGIATCSAEGTCATRCEAPFVASGAACVCPSGQLECAGGCVSATDPAWGCGAGTCSPCSLPNATAACAPAGCAVASCAPGWGDCNGAAGDGCEAPLSTLSDCGGCGIGCSRVHGQVNCDTGICVLAGCATDWASCDGIDANGCETALTTVGSCGACGLPCAPAHASATCDSGACAIASCDPGWGDCDATVANGCETPLNTLANCAGCGLGCSRANGTASCDGGACVLTGCSSGFADCDGADATGCESCACADAAGVPRCPGETTSVLINLGPCGTCTGYSICSASCGWVCTGCSCPSCSCNCS